jgi:squalene synthase HpnC
MPITARSHLRFPDKNVILLRHRRQVTRVSLFAITSQLCPNRQVASGGLAGGAGRGGLDEQEAADLAAPTADATDDTAGIAMASRVSLAVAAKAAAENFPVALRVLPRRYRTHLTALYGFARLTDDIGDEPLPGMPPDATEAEVTKARLALLDDLQADVAKIYDGGGQEPELDAIRALKVTVDQCGVPREPLDDLIEANRQDQLVTRYETFEELTRYCELSANPVGRVVLHIVTEPTPERIRMSDSICTALQLIEHSQDVAEDLANGRIYLPREHRDAFGVTEADLARPTASENVRKLLKHEADLAEKLLDEGTPLIGTLKGPARIAIAGYVAGGRAALKAIRDSGYDVLRSTPKPGKADTIRAMARCYVKGR